MTQFEVNAPHVVGEVLEGEAIAMDLKSGNYYSCLGVGAAIWSYLDGSCDVADIEKVLATRFPEADANWRRRIAARCLPRVITGRSERLQFASASPKKADIPGSMSA